MKYPDRPALIMRYRDPETGKQVARSTGTTNERMALKAAGDWEADLRQGRYKKPQRITWEEFREKYATDYLDGLKVSTAANYEATLNVFEGLAPVDKLASVTTARVTSFVTELRKAGRKPATIARQLRALKVATQWAHRQGLLLNLPQFDMPKHQKGMRRRAVTGEEIERMIAAAPKVMGDVAGPSWQFYLRGLNATGLHLGESLMLRWDDAPGAIVVHLEGRRPMLRIPAESEKGGTHRLLPLTPDAARLLQDVPKCDRHGWVFRLLAKSGEPLERSRWAVGDRIESIAKKAAVAVDRKEKLNDEGEPVTVNVYASAHDLRRAFGTKWARKVMPVTLQQMMRHASIATTMTYYVGHSADATADELWKLEEGNKVGNSEPQSN